MWLTPEWVLAICAGVTLLIFWTATIIGGAIWLMSKLKELKDEILADFNAKHEANAETVKALHVLVMRHDVLLDPEFNNGSGNRSAKHRHS